ncbi:hypothetical protein [Criblamydia sequanensis]|uniref:Uncharacterized protein n=1 Tax=Candidatus Criblamydia sequanensis CRIB-18 TaxID=1437425 RepID=A0A090D1E9_9BACT|nr:hypothetical protein [Criblamydia sequanensis]CDR33750.1 Hypothetical protein CSEC_0923 [Criblamydia sequanensis CRIB-18]
MDREIGKVLKLQKGHRKVRHEVTRVLVKCQAHSNKKNTVVYKDIREQVKKQVQTHLNILCNDIFGYTVNHSKQEPDYNQSLQNYRAWTS